MIGHSRPSYSEKMIGCQGIGASFFSKYQCGFSLICLKDETRFYMAELLEVQNKISQLRVEGEGFEYTEYVGFNELRRTKR